MRWLARCAQLKQEYHNNQVQYYIDEDSIDAETL